MTRRADRQCGIPPTWSNSPVVARYKINVSPLSDILPLFSNRHYLVAIRCVTVSRERATIVLVLVVVVGVVCGETARVAPGIAPGVAPRASIFLLPTHNSSIHNDRRTRSAAKGRARDRALLSPCIECPAN